LSASNPKEVYKYVIEFVGKHAKQGGNEVSGGTSEGKL
jgi:hypothetical protein